MTNFACGAIFGFGLTLAVQGALEIYTVWKRR